MDTCRTFVAIELPRDVRAKLIEHIAQLRRELPDARASWSREDNLHLTLKFLGNIPVSEIPKLSDAIARAVSGMRRFELTVTNCGVFPPRGRPNVLWIGAGSADVPSASSALSTLHAAIEDECADAGFAREPRAFHPHLTIARLRKSGGERRLAEAHKNFAFPPDTFSVSEIVVFKSDLLPQGSRHTAISRHALPA